MHVINAFDRAAYQPVISRASTIIFFLLRARILESGEPRWTPQKAKAAEKILAGIVPADTGTASATSCDAAALSSAQSQKNGLKRPDMESVEGRTTYICRLQMHELSACGNKAYWTPQTEDRVDGVGNNPLATALILSYLPGYREKPLTTAVNPFALGQCMPIHIVQSCPQHDGVSLGCGIFRMVRQRVRIVLAKIMRAW